MNHDCWDCINLASQEGYEVVCDDCRNGGDNYVKFVPLKYSDFCSRFFKANDKVIKKLKVTA